MPASMIAERPGVLLHGMKRLVYFLEVLDERVSTPTARSTHPARRAFEEWRATLMVACVPSVPVHPLHRGKELSA
jgi:hypothetical protein